MTSILDGLKTVELVSFNTGYGAPAKVTKPEGQDLARQVQRDCYRSSTSYHPTTQDLATYRLEGTSCPIYLRYDLIDTDFSGRTPLKRTFQWRYVVSDHVVQRWASFSEMDLKGEWSSNFDAGTLIATQQTTANGSLTSTKYGRGTITVKASTITNARDGSASARTEIDADFVSLRAIIVVSQAMSNGQLTTTGTINGENMGASEVYQLSAMLPQLIPSGRTYEGSSGSIGFRASID